MALFLVMLSQQDQEMQRNVPDPLLRAAAIYAEVGLRTRLCSNYISQLGSIPKVSITTQLDT